MIVCVSSRERSGRRFSSYRLAQCPREEDDGSVQQSAQLSWRKWNVFIYQNVQQTVGIHRQSSRFYGNLMMMVMNSYETLIEMNVFQFLG